MKYKEPVFGEPQVYWDIDDAMTKLREAASLLRQGKTTTARAALELAISATEDALKHAESLSTTT